jgi:hypothetical protein
MHSGQEPKIKQLTPRISLAIGDYDQKLLKKGKGSIFVCNQLLPGMDEKILISLLEEHFKHVRILHPYPTLPKKSVRDRTIQPTGGKVENAFFTLKFIKFLQ